MNQEQNIKQQTNIKIPMKHLLTLALIAITLITNAQTKVYKSNKKKFAECTEVEYNYMSKGYKVQLENGLDMKKGYVIEKTIKMIEGNRTFEFTPLDRVIGSDSICVGFIVKYRYTNENPVYFALPIDLGEQFKKTFEVINAQQMDCYTLAAFYKCYYRFSLNFFIED